jgi:hypothetical protein
MGSPTSKSAEEIHGFEYDWLASDEVGGVALFSTAGAGYAPAAFLSDTDAYDDAIREVLALPASTTAKFAPPVGAGCINTWELVAERGLYAYDCDPNGGPYRLVAAPVVPIRATDLSGQIADIVARIQLPMRFENEHLIADDLLRGV